MRKRLQRTILAACLMAAAGCTSLQNWKTNGFRLGPNHGRPCANTSSGWIDQNDAAISMQQEQVPDWWRVFNDPVLEELVDAVYQQNLTLRTAGLRVLQARLQRQISQRNLWPQVQEGFGQYSRVLGSRNVATFFPPRAFDDWDMGFNLTWEADIWGRLRRQIESEDAALDAQDEAYDDILITLIADIAQTYIDLRGFDERLRLAEQNVEIQTGSLKLAQSRLAAGRDSELDVQQAITNLRDTEALIPTLRQGRRQSANQIAVLLGITPAELHPLLDQRGALPTIPEQAIVGIPANLVRRRPDVRGAEREVARQSALIGVAEAELYPQFTISGEIGLNARDIPDLFSSTSGAGFVAPGFRWNILNYGRLRRNVQIQQLEHQAAIVDYQDTVLTAQREVEDAMVQFLESRNRARLLRESAAAAKRSVELANIQYREGKIDFSQVFVLEGALVSSQDNLIVTQTEIAVGLIQLYRAMGGGWQLRLSSPYCGRHTLNIMSQPSLPASTEDPVDLVPVLQFPDDVTPSPAPLPPVVPPERKSVEEMNAELRELLQQREQKGGSTDDD